MKLIVAVDRNWGIGYRGDLLARVSADLKNFRLITSGKVVVYGSNTLYTFPNASPLKNRTNIVLSRSRDFAVSGAYVAHSLDELFEMLKNYPTDDVYVIGGASVYNQLLCFCDAAYVTKFDKAYKSDVSIPNLDESDEWKCTLVSEEMQSNPETDTEGGLSFCFCTYVRVK